VRRTPALVALTMTLALVTAFAAGASGAAGSQARQSAVARSGPGTWTKISRSGVAIIGQASMVRTSDGVLHVVYPRELSGGTEMLSHTSVSTSGSIVRQNDVLPSGWATMDETPVVVNGAGGMHVLFGGMHDNGATYFDEGRMYMADAASAGGAAWTLPQQAVGLSTSAYATYGTGALELADGTPVAAFVLNSNLTWHVSTDSSGDGSFTSPQCCMYDATLVRDGSTVWAGWYENGGTSGTNGFFAMRIYPTVGTPVKAPGSSVGTSSIPWLTRTAMAARAGGGAYLAYCVGYPTCTKVRIWKVGTSTTADVPGSKGATAIGLSSGPSGRLWVAWVGDSKTVRALRTGVAGLSMGAVRTVGAPSGHGSVYNVAIEGSRGRGDIVVNVGNGLWHTQVLPGLTLHASPSAWRHGARKRVVFTVTDAHDMVSASTVRVGSASCHTGSHGTCTITFPPSLTSGKHTATATKSGYAKADVTLKVG
jgi:hypothetical protein